MREILTIFASIVIVLLTAALGVPYLIDWSSHRAEIETRLGQALGAPIEIAGRIDIKVLPTPVLAIQRFAAGGAEVRLSGESARFELALVPLLRGEFQILQADLDHPTLATKADSTGAIALPALRAGKAEKVQLNSLIIRGGTIALNGPTGPPITAVSDF